MVRDSKPPRAAGRPEQMAGFAQIYREHYGAVHGYLRARLLDANDAEDASQEVFYRGFKALKRFDPSREMRFWLLGIARNVLREHVRKVKRRKETAWTELCLELEQSITGDGQYEDFLPYLPLCTVELGDSAKHAIQWHYMDGLKIKEIADRLDRSLGAVKVLMVRARQALKRCIQAHLARQSS